MAVRRRQALAEVERRGGAIRFRRLRRGGKLLTVAVTRRPGPTGGRTVVTEEVPVARRRRSSRVTGAVRRATKRRMPPRDSRGRFRRRSR